MHPLDKYALAVLPYNQRSMTKQPLQSGRFFHSGIIMEPRCPLCGAKSTWIYFKNRIHLNQRFPADCQFCKTEEAVHWRNWEQGIDVTQYGGHPSNTPTVRELQLEDQ